MDGMLQLKIAPWTRALVTRMVSLGPALAIVLYASSADPKFDIIQAVCEGANVLQAVVLPFALVPALRFSSDPALVGEFALGRCTRACAWAATAGILGSSILSERAWPDSNSSDRAPTMPMPTCTPPPPHTALKIDSG
jgi:manganese transport protein